MTNDRRPQLAALPWYARDFRSATLGWPLVARAVYRELLDAQWDAGALPTEEDTLRLICVATPDEWRVAWPFVRPKFELGRDGRLRNARLEEHRARALERANKASAKASRAAVARWADDAPSTAPGNAPSSQTMLGALHMQCPPSPSPSPSLVLEGNCSTHPRPQKRTREQRPELHQQIIDLYHEVLPTLPKVRGWPKERQRALDRVIAERRAEGKLADTAGYWRDVFERIARNDFLTGRSGAKRNKHVGSLAWLIALNKDRTARNLLDVIEGGVYG